MAEQDPFAGMNEVKTSAIKWGKIGDWVRGTITDNTRQVPNQLSKDKEMQTVFEFQASGGSFHNINVDRSVSEEPTILTEGTFWSIFAKEVLKAQLRNAKIGQQFGIRYVEDKPSKTPGFNPTKVLKVFLGDMDPNYSGQTSADIGPKF